MKLEGKAVVYKTNHPSYQVRADVVTFNTSISGMQWGQQWEILGGSKGGP